MRSLVAIVALSCIAFSVVCGGERVVAASTSVSATVCAAGSVSDVTLVASVDASNVLHIRGSVQQSPYIDIFVDGHKHARIYFTGLETDFFTSVSIAPGSHHIQAFIYDACTDSMLVSETTVDVPYPKHRSAAGGRQVQATPSQSISFIEKPRVFYDDRSQSYRLVTIDQVIHTPFPWWVFFMISGGLMALSAAYYNHRWGVYTLRQKKQRVAKATYRVRRRIILYSMITSLAFFCVALLLYQL